MALPEQYRHLSFSSSPPVGLTGPTGICMKLLEAINTVLRGSNKPAINDLDDQSQDAVQVLRVIREVRSERLSHGYSFNSRKITLAVDLAGKVPVSSVYLDIILPNTKYVVQEDEAEHALYIWDNSTGAWHDATLEEVTVIFDKGLDPSTEDTQFRLFPQKMATMIAREAASRYYEESNGQPSPSLMDKANKAEGHWINSQDYASLKLVTGYSALNARGAGGTVPSWDPRTQTHV